jgi:hypothetical protein
VNPGNDINVTGVWTQGITGKGVNVAILDDGVDHTHKDLADNFVKLKFFFTNIIFNLYFISLQKVHTILMIIKIYLHLNYGMITMVLDVLVRFQL